MADLYNLYVRIGVDTGEFEEGIRQATQTGEQASERIGASTIAVGALMADLVKKAASTLVDVAKTGIQYNAQIEQYTVALTTALGDAGKAASAIEAIKKDAASTPFSVDGLVKANSYLISAGENAESARATIMALSDAVSASGGGNEELQRMSQNLQQIKNVGKATSMDIRQFAMAGIDVYGILADYLGTTTAEVQEMTISYDMLTGALQRASAEGGRFYQANLAQSRTLNGQLSTLTDNTKAKIGEAFEGITETLQSSVLPMVNSFVEDLDVSEAVTNVTALGAAFTGVAVALNAAKIGEKITAINTALKTLFMSPWGVFALGIGAVTAAVIEGSHAQDKYIESLVNTGETSSEVKAQMESLQSAIEEAAKADALYGTYTDMDSEKIALGQLTERYYELKDAEKAAADAAYEAATAEEYATTIYEDTEANLAELASAYADTYDKISKSVSGYFDTFDKASKIQAASIDQMMANMQSQIDFNDTYAASIATIANSGIEGMDELAASFAGTGKEGANYAKAIADAIDSGNVTKVEELANKWKEVQASEEGLTAAMAETTSAFDDLAREANNDITSIEKALNKLDGRHIKIYYDGEKTGNHPQGFAVGLSYVPYDEFPAMLHKGERVLTAAENKAYTNNTTNNNGVTIVQNISSTPQTPVQLAAATAAYFEQARWAI